MKKLAIIALSALVCANAFGVTLYDQLTQVYTDGNGAWDGGINDLGSDLGLQVGQRVTAVAGGTTVTNVTGRFLMFSANPTINGAFVQVFDLSGNTVGSLVGQASVTAGVTSQGPDALFGLNLFDVSANVSIGGLTVGNDYLVVLQGQGPNWGFIARETTSGIQNAFNRDFSNFGFAGGYGHTNWTEMGADGFSSGNTSMQVTAVPEPATMAVLSLGAAALLRRRKKA